MDSGARTYDSDRLSKALIGPALIFYGAGLGLVTALLLFAAAAGHAIRRLASGRRRSALPDPVGVSSPAAAARASGSRAAGLVWPSLFLVAAAASAPGSASPTASWGAVALLGVMLVIFAFARTWQLDLPRVRRAGSYLAFGAVVLAGMSLDGFLRSGVAATPYLGKNGAGTLLATALPLAQLTTAGILDPVLAWAGVLVLVAALFLTMSQGGWVGAAAGQAVLLLLASRRLRRHAAILAVVAAVMVGALAAYVLASGGTARQLLLSRLDLQSSSKTERLLIWEASWQMFLDHPWRGVGIGAFRAAYPAYRLEQATEPEMSFAHNLVLNLLAETGIPGLVTFALVVGGWVRRSLRALGSARQPEHRDTMAALLAALAAMLTHQLFDGTFWSLHVGVGFWILGALLLHAAEHESEEVEGSVGTGA